MTTILAIIVIFGIGFYIGTHVGYEKVMTDVRNVIERVERQGK